MSKERISSEEKIKEVEIVLGRKKSRGLSLFVLNCEHYLPQIKNLFPHSPESIGPAGSFLIDQYSFLRSLKDISEQILECFKEDSEFRIVPKGKTRNGKMSLWFEPRVEGGAKIEGDYDYRKFGFLFNRILYDEDPEKVDEIKEILENGETVILKYDKSKY